MLLSVWRVPVPFLWCGGSWLGCAVVPVMRALFQSWGWLPIVEAPGYFRHPTSILAMQLLITGTILTSISQLLQNIRPTLRHKTIQHLTYNRVTTNALYFLVLWKLKISLFNSVLRKTFQSVIFSQLLFVKSTYVDHICIELNAV